jgi:hypothetical protein
MIHSLLQGKGVCICCWHQIIGMKGIDNHFFLAPCVLYLAVF